MENFEKYQENNRKDKDIISSLLPVHTLTGCDTVPIMFGAGNKKLLIIIKKLLHSVLVRRMLVILILWESKIYLFSPVME